MRFSPAIAIVLALYVLGMGFLFWFCVVADAETSPTARFVSRTLPAKFMQLASKVVGRKGVKIIETIMDRALAIVYLTIVVGGFGVLWLYAYPWVRQSSHVADYHLTIGYIVLFIALWTWRLAMTTSPGIITTKSLKYYDHFPYDDLLYVEGRTDPKRGDIPRLPRSKFDRMKYNQHVPRFDHFCGWIFNTVGEENYRYFLLFVLVQLGMCLYATVLLAKLFLGEIEDKKLWEVTFFDRTSGEEFKAGYFVVFQYLFHRHLFEAGMMAVTGVLTIALIGFIGYHCYITSVGMTTNEHFKWGDVKRWHKEETKKYQRYLKQQKKKNVKKANNHDDNASENANHSKLHISDGDVTCTGGKPSEADRQTRGKNAQLQQDETVEDPGPMPKNLYNRGFVQNWKEVLFPQSLQRREAAALAKAKSKAT